MSHRDCVTVQCRTCGMGIDVTCPDGPQFHADRYDHDPNPDPEEVARAQANGVRDESLPCHDCAATGLGLEPESPSRKVVKVTVDPETGDVAEYKLECGHTIE